MTRVLITRAEPDASIFAQSCRASGLEPIVCPVMAVDIEKAAPDLSGIGALAFTSANGVRAFAANSDMRALPVFAVGPVTADAARAAGFRDVATASGDVEALAGHIVSESALSMKTVLHVAGADRAGDLVAMLQARGLSARRQMLYRATPQNSLSVEAVRAIQTDESLWISLFSPRTARLFLALAGDAGLTQRLSHLRAACLSDAVANAAADAAWAELAVVSDRTAKGVIDLVCAGKCPG